MISRANRDIVFAVMVIVGPTVAIAQVASRPVRICPCARGKGAAWSARSCHRSAQAPRPDTGVGVSDERGEHHCGDDE